VGATHGGDYSALSIGSASMSSYKKERKKKKRWIESNLMKIA